MKVRGSDVAGVAVGWLGSAFWMAWMLAVLTAGNYLAWLGWDQRGDVGRGGVVADQYEPWQVVGLVLGLAIVAAFAGWRRHSAVAIAVIPTVMTLCFSVDAAPDSPLWAIGAVLVAVGTLIGVTLVASFVMIAQQRREAPGDGRLGRTDGPSS
jgi:hypothetical protein